MTLNCVCGRAIDFVELCMNVFEIDFDLNRECVRKYVTCGMWNEKKCYKYIIVLV